VRRRSVSGFPARNKQCQRLIQSLNSLEQSLNPCLAVCGSLLRFSPAHYIIYQLLPDGRSVQYLPPHWRLSIGYIMRIGISNFQSDPCILLRNR
jgi:hypothetical protein